MLREQPRTVAQVLAEYSTPTDVEIRLWENAVREIKKEKLLLEEREFDWRTGESPKPLKRKSQAKVSRIRANTSPK